MNEKLYIMLDTEWAVIFSLNGKLKDSPNLDINIPGICPEWA